MEKLKVLERVAQAINHLLLSFEILKKKSEQLKQLLQCIRNLLPVGCSDTLVLMVETDTNKVESTKQVQLEIQKFQDGLSEIIRFFLISEFNPGPNPNHCQTNSEFDNKCYKLITSAVSLIIEKCMEECDNLLSAGEIDGFDLSNLALPESLPTLTLPSNLSSNSKKRKRSSSKEITTEVGAVLKENSDEKGGSSQKKPKHTSPTEPAFNIDVVLLKIFSHSSPSDLKEFRLVNRQWNDTATSTLLLRKSLSLILGNLPKEDRARVDLSSDPMSSKPRFQSQAKSESGSHFLRDLFVLIESSVKFPTQSLTFACANAELHPQVRQVLKIFGNQVKELSFVDYFCEVPTSCLRELLRVLVPNLENLTLRGIVLVEKKQSLSTTDPDGVNSFECDRIQSLPHLKQLVFLPCEDKFNLAQPKSNYLLHMEFFKELVNAAVNLRSVDTRALDFVEVLLDAGKVQLLKKFAFQPTKKVEKRLGGTVIVRPDAIYQKLASMKPEFKKLKMLILKADHGLDPLLLQNFESALNSLLESSKDSLCDFKMEILPGFAIHWPVFSNLKKLKIGVANELNHELFTYSPTFSFQQTFPHLQELHLSLYSYMDVHIKDLFRGELKNWINPTVKHLTFRGNMSYQGEGETGNPFEGPGMLGKMFPSVTSAVIVFDQYSFAEQQLSPIIWHHIPVGVKHLSISIFFVMDPVQDIVDTFFTGMSIKICKSLRTFPQIICGENDSATLGPLRTRPSICDFKNLEKLNICCYDLQSEQPFASHVTGLYAFGLMPQLKVTFTYEPKVEGTGNTTPSQDMERSLKHIAPFITQVCHRESY